MSGPAPWMAPGRSRVSSFLVCPNADEVVAFAMSVFEARPLRDPLYRGDGTLWNAELDIGGSTVMIGAAQAGMSRPGFVYVHVPDADATCAAAVAAGGTVIMPPQLQFYGDYDGGVEDMGGNWWWISTHRETVGAAEIESRARAQENRRTQGT